MKHPLMDNQPTRETISIQEISFPNGKALAIVAPPDAPVTSLVQALGIPQPGSLIMIAGGAAQMNEGDRANLVRLFSAGIAYIAATHHALVIDGGTLSGVMELMGQGVARQPQRPALLGISPSENIMYPGKTPSQASQELTPLDPNHSHFVLVDSDQWGGETETMYKLAEVYSQSCPSVAILVNGGAIARNEALYNVRQSRPIIVIKGSGRLADQIVEALHASSSLDSDPDMAEILNKGKLYEFPITGSPVELEQLIQRLFNEQP